MLKQTIFILALASIVYSCDRKPFVEHKLKLEETTKECRQASPNFRMVSNFGGERFEFEKCLPAGYSDKDLHTERKGDTVVVKFTNSTDKPENKVWSVILDIDSYPKYNFITIDEETYPLSPALNK